LKKITIAIDGFSSTGKSTIAKQLANKLHYIYVDSGAMYRAVTLFAMQQGLISLFKFQKNELITQLDNIELKFVFNEKLGYGEIYLNNESVEDKIRSLAVSNLVSKVAEVSEIRKKLVKQQQAMGIHKGVVMDGRDIGTVVFPEAELKFFISASAKIRAKRRYDELIKKGEKVSFKDILKNVEERDFIDTTRNDSPLLKAKDAIEIDNSNLSIKEQFDTIYKIALSKIKAINDL
jgi:cytidylate kinase